MGSKARGVDNLRTMSGSVTETTHPHRKHLKLAVLAMEQARKVKEKASAQRRIDRIDKRLAEIALESKALLQVCNEVANIEAENVSMAEQARAARPAKRGFALKY